jgi:tetratricopeptide (TPR) repeat protein
MAPAIFVSDRRPNRYAMLSPIAKVIAGSSMRNHLSSLLCNLAVAVLLNAALPAIARATGAEPARESPVDPAPCLTAAAANDDDRIVAECGALVDNEKTARADRIKALIARGGALGRKDQLDRAFGDYDTVLRLDPTLADIYNARGELRRKQGDRPKALADFGAAIKLNPGHPTARGKPSFNCAAARRPVEKTICANPEFANLDREINAVNAKVVRDANADSARAGRALQREQDEFIARRNASFGRPDYDLQKAMRERLDHLMAVERY